MGIVEYRPRSGDEDPTKTLTVEGDPHPRPVGRPLAAAYVAEHGDPVEFVGTHASALDDRPVAVISDVHANLPALEAVLDDIEARGIERVWCLGDTVGYGASPVECLRLVREQCELVLAGNHDLAAVGDESISRFGMHARPGVALAQLALRDAPDGVELHAWLATRLTEVADARRSTGFGLAHESQLAHHRMDALAPTRLAAAHACPSPFDTLWDYVGLDVDPAWIREALGVPLVLVGHAHEQLHVHGVCNPGSVGQPRDGDARAAWAELTRLSPGPREDLLPVVLHRTDYDIERAQAAMRLLGMPGITIDRLQEGS